MAYRFKPPAGALCCLYLLIAASGADAYQTVRLIEGQRQTAIDRNIVRLLADRLESQTSVQVEVIRESAVKGPAAGELAFLRGSPQRHQMLQQVCQDHRIPPPTRHDPGGEGFVLESIPHGDCLTVVAAAVDQRGLLYAMGEILRRIECRKQDVDFKQPLHLRTAPAFLKSYGLDTLT